MSFIVSFKERWSIEAQSYSKGYSSIYFSEYLIIELKDYSPKLRSKRIHLYDITVSQRERMIQDITETGHLQLEKYYSEQGRFG